VEISDVLIEVSHIHSLPRIRTKYLDTLTARWNRRVVVVVSRVHAKPAAGKRPPKRTRVGAGVAVHVRLDPCITGSQDWDKSIGLSIWGIN
jgi:hypothetical protein